MRATLARCRLACVAAATGIAATDASSFHRSTGLALLGAAWIAATLLLVDSRRRHDQSSLPVLATAAVDAVLIAVWIGMLPAGGGQYIGLVVLGSAANSVLLKGRRLAFVGALRCAGASTAYWSARGLSTEALRVYLLAIVADTVVSLLVALLATEERHRGRAQMEAARRAAALAADLRRRQAIHEATGAITAESGLDETLAGICSAAGHLLDASFATVVLRDGDRREIRGSWELPAVGPDTMRTVNRSLRDRMPSGIALRTGTPVWIENAEAGLDPDVQQLARTWGWRGCLALPLTSSGVTIGALSVYFAEPRPLDDDARVLGELLAAEAAGVVRLAQAVEELRRQATTDSLTELHNFRHARDRLTAMLADAARKGRPLSVLFVDVDNLKEVNDREGHARGDALLIAVARALQAQLRTSDLCARAGGDEFLVVLPETDASEASVVAERIRTAASALDRGTAAATVSIGHATAPEAGVAVDELVRAADLAMYVAKRTGRNWVQGYAEEVSLHLIGGDARLGTRT